MQVMAVQEDYTSDSSSDDDSCMDLYAHVEKSNRRVERRRSDKLRSSGHSNDNGNKRGDRSGSEPRSTRRLSKDSVNDSPTKSPRTSNKSAREEQCRGETDPRSQSSGSLLVRRVSAKEDKSLVEKQPSGMLASFLDSHEAATQRAKGSRSVNSAPVVSKGKATDSSVGSRNTGRSNSVIRRSSLTKEESGSTRSIDYPSHSSRRNELSKQESRRENTVRATRSHSLTRLPSSSALSSSGIGKADVKTGDSLLEAKLREIRNGQDKQSRASYELKRQMAHRTAYRSSSSRVDSTRNITASRRSSTPTNVNSSRRSSLRERGHSEEYLNSLFATQPLR